MSVDSQKYLLTSNTRPQSSFAVAVGLFGIIKLNLSALKVQRLVQGLKVPFTPRWTHCFHDCLDHDDAQDILAPFLLWCFPYSTLHILLPRNVCPNIASSTPGILAGACVRFVLWISLPNLIATLMADTRYAYAHGLYLLHLSVSLRLRYRRFAQSDPDISIWCLLAEHGIGISLPRRRVLSGAWRCGCYDDSPSQPNF